MHHLLSDAARDSPREPFSRWIELLALTEGECQQGGCRACSSQVKPSGPEKSWPGKASGGRIYTAAALV
jgi:hypothetical protein